jgi:hypothetical protein
LGFVVLTRKPEQTGLAKVQGKVGLEISLHVASEILPGISGEGYQARGFFLANAGLAGL